MLLSSEMLLSLKRGGGGALEMKLILKWEF